MQKFRKDIKRFMDSKAVTMLFDVLIEEDSQACIADVWNDRLSKLSKHID